MPDAPASETRASAFRWRIEGHAILSPEDCIADASGAFPPALGDANDWARFQAALDACAATVLARASHEATPNAARRLRVVMSRGHRGLTRGLEAWEWNPADIPVPEMLAAVVPEGGRIGVPGGRAAFDLFLPWFDSFHLARNPSCPLPGGRPVFSGLGPARSAERALAEAGLVPGPTETLTPETGVTLTEWRRPGGPAPCDGDL